VSGYQELSLNQEFAEKAYTAAMASLDLRGLRPIGTQAYLAIYGEPSVAGTHLSARWLDIWMVFFLATVLWAVACCGVATVPTTG